MNDDLTASTIAAGVRNGSLKAVDVLETHLARIAQREPQVHAFNLVLADQARAAAAAIDASVAAGDDPGPLAGVPIALKDNMCTRGIPTTCSSKILDRWKPPYDATVVSKLAAAGAVLVGKTNLDEFAMGSSTENSAFGPTFNPHDTTRVAGGSSGGSAAAVAAGFAAVGLGSDTGGSIRQPAALCGVVGVKPTYGYVSRHGLIAFASSLDQIGPFAGTVRDAALVLDTIGGHDPLDSTSIPAEHPSLVDVLDRGVEGVRVGRITDLPAGADPDVAERLEVAFDAMRAAGAVIVDVQVPAFAHALTAYYLIAPAEASSNLARFDGVRYGLRVESADTNAMYNATRSAGFGDEVKRRIMLGTFALSAGYFDAYYGRALKVRRLIHDDFARAYQQAEVLLTPTSPTEAWVVGAKGDDPLTMYLSDIYTIPTNLAGHPGMSVPFGTGAHGLPVGVQVLAGTLDEPTMFRVGAALERAAVSSSSKIAEVTQ
jgi:aspartyl-tRNA(Asn)/glutamyl-tRNA(Gln) amidotransferase subunit A